jgi:tubulin-specific chaperone C
MSSGISTWAILMEFRMHDSRDTDVYLSCSSRPIIENSSGIGFGEYPTAVRETAGFDAREGDWYVNGLVEDFNWLRKEHSPNWAITEKVDKDTWSKVLKSIGVLDVNGILDLVIKR